MTSGLLRGHFFQGSCSTSIIACKLAQDCGGSLYLELLLLVVIELEEEQDVGWLPGGQLLAGSCRRLHVQAQLLQRWPRLPHRRRLVHKVSHRAFLLLICALT